MVHKKIGIAILAIFLAAGSLLAQAPNKYAFPFSQYKLKNGLQVILSEDDSLPVVSVAVAYRVGSIHELPGKSGLAYLMENMMFSGSADVPPQQHFNNINRVGGNLNASVSEDMSIFYQTVPSNQLALVLWMESDRMRYLEINEDSLEQTRKELLDVMRQRKSADPYLENQFSFDQLLYMDFPYSHPLLGSEDDLRNLTLDDVKIFYATYYVPNNAVLCITGNFNKVKTGELITRYFDTIPKGKDIGFVPEPYKYIKKQVIKTEEDSLALAPAFYMGFRLSLFAPNDLYSLTILDYILMRGRSSRIMRRLLGLDNKIARQLGGGIEKRRDRFAYKIFVVAVNPYWIDQCQNAIFSELDKLKTARPSDAELDKAKNMFKRDYLDRMATTQDKAIFLCEKYFGLSNLDDLPLEFEKIMKVSNTDIVTVVHRYFTIDNSLILNVKTK
jgi:predicted Zn-dependent peptidase